MQKFSIVNFELLKKELASTAGVTTVTPADCKSISYKITKATEQRISETTLKRIYGFAVSQFKPSLFTIDVIAKYCGYNGWDDFCHRQETEPPVSTPENANWTLLKQNAEKITEFTLDALKTRSGIAYNQTIKRAFINAHMQAFISSGQSGTVLAAPAGCGKTIALCHWVEEQIVESAQLKNNDIFLFFSSSALMSALLFGRDINEWLLGLLGYKADQDFTVLFDANQHRGGKFYLIIDGLDEHIIKNDQFQRILNQITDLLSLHQSHDWFKLILTMRVASWVNNRHELEGGNNKLYTGFIADNDCINVPLFSIEEIRELCLRINPAIKTFIALDVAESFNHPLYFQFYYKQYKEDFSLNNVDHISIYELISMFILNKIYMGQHSDEKVLLIRKLVEAMNLENGGYTINKLKVNDLIKEHSQAYHELLSIGFLQELNKSSDYQYNTNINFGNHNFLGHSIAKNLLYKNGEHFDSNLIKTINTLFANSPHKLTVLKWCIIDSVKSGQRDTIERLTEISLTSNEKAGLINFLGDLLDKETINGVMHGSMHSYFRQTFSEKMFDYFFGLELFTPDYKKTLYTLLKFDLPNRKRILVYTALSILAVTTLDLKELNALLAKLRSFSVSDYHYFAVNPLLCFEAIYQYLKFGTVNRNCLMELTKLSFNPPEDPYNLKNSASNDMLYLLAAYTLLLSNNARKSLRFLNVLETFYKKNPQEFDYSQYGFFIKMMLADVYFKLGDRVKIASVYYSVSNSYKKEDNLLTPYMKTLFFSLKIKLLLNSAKEDSIVSEMKNVNDIAEQTGSKLSKFYVLAILLQKNEFLMKHPAFKKQIYYDFVTMVRDADMHINEIYYVHQ